MISIFHTRIGKKGFTLVELMIVIAIIGVLAAIAIPQFSLYRKKGFNTAAKEDVKNAYTAAQAFFSSTPDVSVTSANLTEFGYKATVGVILTIGSGSMSALSISMKHTNGDKTYTMDSVGTITE
jgi:prepilin-type N-terminal cleavage/methylation domain-containing protein